MIARYKETLTTSAVVGAAAGTFNKVLLKHGVNEEDASYYNDQLKSGGTLVTVTTSGGHSAARPKTAAM